MVSFVLGTGVRVGILLIRPSGGRSLCRGVTALSGTGYTAKLARAPGSLFRESIVFWRVSIPVMKLPEFLQTAYRKVVERFFCPVFAFWIVKPFDEI